MNRMKQDGKRSFLWGLFNYKCSRCRTGDMFLHKSTYQLKTFLEMHEHCPACEQRIELERGFYDGTAYVSYSLAVAFSVSTFIAWRVLIGMSFSTDDNRMFWWLGINAGLMLLLQPYFMRFSRAVWLAIFVKYNPDWKSEKPVNTLY